MLDFLLFYFFSDIDLTMVNSYPSCDINNVGSSCEVFYCVPLDINNKQVQNDEKLSYFEDEQTANKLLRFSRDTESKKHRNR
ncbi:hypothetical protein CWI38_1956p0020 [Hamiltosporidium tvaerminnensis]|uniref:Uncharacterized protein n=1 Tax=Hamiltosporidium tvaerminnensis TaxID=1176355 RepID=A0A4Q9LP44_9MICR|nr:hypothetical protein CWI38_1956p0020 [Hamiltosporidium tvaerminnensis]